MLTVQSNDIQERKLDFKHLPAYISFLKTNHLDEFVRYQLKVAKDIDLPMLRFFQGVPDEQLVEMSKVSVRTLFDYLIENRAEEQIDFSIKQWTENQLPKITRDQIVAEDITLSNYMRKQALLHFLQAYSTDITEVIQIVKEIDSFILESGTRITNVFINILKAGIEEEVYFKNRITETSPGVIFVYDFNLQRHVYINQKVESHLGYTLDELKALGQNVYSELIHPDDLNAFRNRLSEFLHMKEGEMRSFEYRLKNRDSGYRWLRNYETIFKRDEHGLPYQVIGIALDINEEKKIAGELQNSREQLLEAQELAEIGSYEWDLLTDQSKYTPQVAKIFGFTRSIKVIEFIDAVHPADRMHVESCLNEAFSRTGKYDCEYRYYAGEKEKIIWSRGVVEFEDGKAVKLKGTVMDVTERHHMIQRLQRSEDLYKQAQALSHMGNWTWELRRQKISWSDELFRIFGLEPQAEEITYQRLISFVHPQDKENFEQKIREALKTLQPMEYEFRIVLHDGSVKVLEGKVEVLSDPDGVAFKLFGACQDVTRQKEVERQLTENQNLIRKIADATPSIITAYNVHNGKYLFINQAIEKILGYKKELVMEIGAAGLAEYMHPDDINTVMEKNANALALANTAGYDIAHDMVVEFKYRMRHANGEYRWLQTYGTIFDRNADNQVEHVLNISTDITEMVEAEMKVQDQQHFIQHIADASPTVLYLFEVKSGSIIYVNREIENILGYAPDEVTAMGSDVIGKLFHPDDAAQLPVRLQDYNLSENPKSLFQFECRLRHKNGNWCWVLIREIVFKRNSHGKISEVLGAALDISMRKEMEDTLYHQTIELQQSNTSLGEFAYVASHDLKEPLRKISTFGDRLINSHAGALDPEGKVYLDKIIDSSRRMQQLIDDLLSISVISSEKNYSMYSLKKIVEEVVQALEHKMEEKKAIVKTSELPSAVIVPSQFRQLFQNLLSNSLKFSKKDITPVISISHKMLRPYELPHSSLAKAKMYLEIKFSDNGIGFDKLFSEKIFTIFQRLHSRSQFEGTGIGLAICKRIVENHGGVIFGTGKPGEGATFTIIIPAAT